MEGLGIRILGRSRRLGQRSTLLLVDRRIQGEKVLGVDDWNGGVCDEELLEA